MRPFGALWQKAYLRLGGSIQPFRLYPQVSKAGYGV